MDAGVCFCARGAGPASPLTLHTSVTRCNASPLVRAYSDMILRGLQLQRCCMRTLARLLACCLLAVCALLLRILRLLSLLLLQRCYMIILREIPHYYYDFLLWYYEYCSHSDSCSFSFSFSYSYSHSYSFYLIHQPWSQRCALHGQAAASLRHPHLDVAQVVCQGDL